MATKKSKKPAPKKAAAPAVGGPAALAAYKDATKALREAGVLMKKAKKADPAFAFKSSVQAAVNAAVDVAKRVEKDMAGPPPTTPA
jgi:hypothetical protein